MATDTLTKQSWVQKTPNVCGGDPCIRNTRITVHGLVHYRQLGLTDQRLLEVIQGLTQDDLTAAGPASAPSCGIRSTAMQIPHDVPTSNRPREFRSGGRDVH